MAFKQRVFSGVQPTGNLHLGNYLGAIKRFVELQQSYDCIYCVVDLHAITGPVSVWGGPKELVRATREVTAAYIACGIDPKRHIVFNQSQVHQHAELAWVFNCVARMGWLGRMTQFKEKAGKDRENASVGLFAYPSLMAADILVYRATHVPVGEDQKQHLELTPRHRAEVQQRLRRVDRRARPYGRLLSADRADHPGAGHAHHVAARRHQEDVEVGCVGQFAHQSDRRRRHDRAESPPREDRSRAAAERGGRARAAPEADNLVGIYAALADIDKAEVLKQFGGGQFSTFKTALADLAVAKLAPIAAEMKRLTQDMAYIDRVLADGSDRASAIAAETMNAVKDILGFIRH